MDRGDLDERLREVYESNAPMVDETEFASRLRRKSNVHRTHLAHDARPRRTLIIALASLVLVAAVAVGAYEAVLHLEQGKRVVVINDDSMSPNGSAAGANQVLLEKALTWIEAAPTKVTFGPYTIAYGAQAKVAEVTVDPHPSGEPLLSGPVWWSSDTDYYIQDGTGGPPQHVTPSMAQEMSTQTYPGASSGASLLAILRMVFDPHRLLQKSLVTKAAKEADGTWDLEATITARDLIGLDIPDQILLAGTGISPSKVLRTTLKLGADGGIHAMSTLFSDSASDATNYVWARSSTEPSLPSASVEMDQTLRQSAFLGGWRASLADAAKDIGFPVYSLGETYLGLSLRLIHVELTYKPTIALLLEYDPGQKAAPLGTATTVAAGETTTSGASGESLAPGGFVLFEYPDSNVPDGEKSFVAKKILLKTVSHGGETYSIYTTPKGKPGRSILVKAGTTYVSIERSGGGTGDATDELVAAAEALQRVGTSDDQSSSTSQSDSRTLAGLNAVRLDMAPRVGVHLQAHLGQASGSDSVSLRLMVKNNSDSAFSFSVDDFTLYIDGSPLKAKAQVHQPDTVLVQPGDTAVVEGGYFWLLSSPTSKSSGLFYASSDPGSAGFNKMVSAQ